MSKKYFINNLDTPFGQALIQQLVKQPTQDPVHMCTLKQPANQKQNGIKKVLKRQKPKLFAKKATQECEVYVYNIDQTDISDIDFGIQMMKKPFEDNKIFILVSDLMAWSASDRKIKKQAPPPAAQGQGGQGQGQVQKKEQQIQKPQGSQVQQSQNKSQQNEQNLQRQDDQVIEKQIEYTFYQDYDYKDRIAPQKFRYINEIQDKVLAIKRQNIKVFVVCPGVIYGCGEDTFYQLFRAAWLQNPSKLPYIGEGINQIPTIHLKDLVKFVVKLAQGPPEQGSPYLLAFDQSQDKTQKAIVQAISKGIGSGEIQQVSTTPLIQHQNIDRFLLNIDIRPSKFFVGTAQEPIQFQWTAKKGVSQNIKSLLKDFCQKQSLRPMKILMLQNQKQWRKQSKVEFILKTFSEYYRVPVLTINNILQEVREFADAELLEDLNEEWQNILNYLKSQAPNPNLDQTMKVFYRCIRWRLQRNDCVNRGFILQNFPNFREQLEMIFNRIPMKKFKRKVPKKKKQIPPPVIVQQKTEKQIQQGEQGQEKQESSPPIQQPPKEEQQKPAQQEPAEAEQQEAADGEQGQKPKVQPFYPQTLISIKRMGQQSPMDIVEYFTSKGMEQLVYDTSSKKQHDIFESLRSHVERNGRPNNYLISEEELLKKHLENISKQNKESLEERQKRNKKIQESKKAIQSKREQLAAEMIEIVQNEGEQEIKKMPFRNYLMEFVVPTLNQGLLQVSNIIPNDPVDLLAEYLYQKSYDV